VAFIYKGSGVGTVYHSQLANAGPDASAAHARQKDAYKLALAGSRDMKREWNDFASECPSLARLVVADVENERREGAEVSRQLDKRLREAERLTTKGRKPGKVTKSRKKSVALVPGELDTVLAIDNPLRREVAYALLMGRRGQ